MLRPRQARSLGGQKNVTLNELLEIQAAKNNQDAAFKSTYQRPIAIRVQTMAISAHRPHTPARPRPFSLARSAFLQSIPGTIPAKPLLPLAKIALERVEWKFWLFVSIFLRGISFQN